MDLYGSERILVITLVMLTQ